MEKLLAWLKSKNINTHTVAAALVAVCVAFCTDQQVRDFVLGLFSNHPRICTTIVSVAGIVFKYSHSSKGA